MSISFRCPRFCKSFLLGLLGGAVIWTGPLQADENTNRPDSTNQPGQELAITDHSATTVLVPVIDFPASSAWQSFGFFDFHGWSNVEMLMGQFGGPPQISADSDDLAGSRGQTDGETSLPTLAAERIANLSTIGGGESVDAVNAAAKPGDVYAEGTERPIDLVNDPLVQSNEVATTLSVPQTVLGVVAARAQRWMEPFAMVEPHGDRWGIAGSVESAKTVFFELAALAQNAQAPQPETTEKAEPAIVVAPGATSYFDEFVESLDRRLQMLALSEPIDIETAGDVAIETDAVEEVAKKVAAIALPSPYPTVQPEVQTDRDLQIDDSADQPSDSIVVTRRNPLVGGSVVIAMVDDGYLAYDLAARDRALKTLPTDASSLRAMLSTPERPYKGVADERAATNLTEVGSLADILDAYAVDLASTSKITRRHPGPMQAKGRADAEPSTPAPTGIDDSLSQLAGYLANWTEQINQWVDRGSLWVQTIAESAQQVDGDDDESDTQEQIAQSAGSQLLARAGAVESSVDSSDQVADDANNDSPTHSDQFIATRLTESVKR